VILRERLPPRLAAKIGPLTANGCIPWMAAKTNGYGVVQYAGTLRRAHRVIYELTRGAIEPGKELDHLCRNRACINPDHMDPVRQAENNRRSNSRSAQHARQTHCLRGHEFTPENTYTRSRGHKTERFCRACSRMRDAGRYRRTKKGGGR